MAVKTGFLSDDFGAILTNYDLGDFRAAQPLSEGTVQSLYRVTTTTGDIIFKYYENRPLESVRFEANVVDYVHRQGFPCAATLKNRQGRAVGIYRQKPYIMFEYIEGQSLANLNAQQRRQIVHTAAHLQTITRRYKPRWRGFRWNYSPALCLQLAQAEAQTIGTPNARAKLAWFEHELGQLRLPRSLPKGICHGDYDLSNLFFRDGEFVALLDFDDANYTYLTFDLVNLIDAWAWRHEQDFNPAHARQIVQDYGQVRALSKLEQRYLFDVHKLQIMFDGIWFFARGQADDFNEKRKIEHLDRMGRAGYHQALFETRA